MRRLRPLLARPPTLDCVLAAAGSIGQRADLTTGCALAGHVASANDHRDASIAGSVGLEAADQSRNSRRARVELVFCGRRLASTVADRRVASRRTLGGQRRFYVELLAAAHERRRTCRVVATVAAHMAAADAVECVHSRSSTLAVA